MELARPFDPKDLRFEYGLDGIRLLPWPGASIPFGGPTASSGHDPNPCAM